MSFAIQNPEEPTRIESSSGGVFSSIATYVLKKGGVVFGAIFNGDFELNAIFVSSVDDLHKFRDSKYMEGKVGHSFYEGLYTGGFVCFSGTPCQIEGLNSFLKRELSLIAYQTIIIWKISVMIQLISE